MKKLYKTLLSISTVVCLILSCVFVQAANVNVTNNFKVQGGTSCRIPLTSSYTDTLTDKVVCVYEMVYPLSGQLNFTEAEGINHYTTGSFEVNLNFSVSPTDNTMQFDFSYDGVINDNLCTTYRAVSNGLNSMTMRIAGIFSNFHTYSYVANFDLGNIYMKIYKYIDVALEPPTYITLNNPSFTTQSVTLYSPGQADLYSNMAGQIIRALDDGSVDIDTIISLLRSIYNQDATMFANILTYIDGLETNQNSIIVLLYQIKNQDAGFYSEVREYLSAFETEASEAAIEATRVQEEASSIASELDQTEPDLAQVELDMDDIGTVSSNAHSLFFYLSQGSVLLQICIYAFVLATVSYIMYGRH